MRTASGEPGERSAVRAALTSLLALMAGLGLSGCESGLDIGPPPFAQVRVHGEVTDPSGTGVENATVTLVLHESQACTSSTLSTSSVDTSDGGTYDAGPGTEVSSAFEPRDVCLEVRAEPPSERSDLGASEPETVVVTLRNRLGGEPLDEVEVDLTLTAAGNR